MDFAPSKAARVSMACAVLHNFVKEQNEQEIIADDDLPNDNDVIEADNEDDEDYFQQFQQYGILDGNQIRRQYINQLFQNII